MVIDVRAADDPRDVVHRTVQDLAQGRLLGLPTETLYHAAASALCEPAVERLAQAAAGKPEAALVLAVRSADEALDYLPELSGTGLRLARRCWPGPVTLVFPDHHPDSLLRQLSPRVQELLLVEGGIAMSCSAHWLLVEVLRLLAGPVVLSGRCAAEASTGQQFAQCATDVDLVLDDGRSHYAQPATVVRVSSDGYQVVRPGVVSAQTIAYLTSTVVLFVCTGNTCRSPMAETLFRAAAARRLGCAPDELHSRGLHVVSAGLAAIAGGPASPEAVAVMQERGLNLADHASQPISERLLQQADLILTMTRSHREAIVSQWPALAGRVHLLCRDGSDVSDPVGGTLEQYRRCAEQIERQVAAWLEEVLVHRAGEPIK
jgi:protein-tyrosine phosphatase